MILTEHEKRVDWEMDIFSDMVLLGETSLFLREQDVSYLRDLFIPKSEKT